MKRSLLLTLSFSLCYLTLLAQISLEHTYPQAGVYRSYFPLSGERYILTDPQTRVTEFYDQDHQLQEVIDPNLEGADLLYVNNFYEGVFSSDPGIYLAATYNSNGQNEVRIVDPEGTIVQSFPGAGNVTALPKIGDGYWLTYAEITGQVYDLEVYEMPGFTLVEVFEEVKSPLFRVPFTNGDGAYLLLNALNQIEWYDENLNNIGIINVGASPDEIVFVEGGSQGLFNDDLAVEYHISKYDPMTNTNIFQIWNQNGDLLFSTDNYLSVYGNEAEGFSFFSPTTDLNGNAIMEVYTAKDFVLETTYDAEGLLVFRGVELQNSGKSLVLMYEQDLRIEQYDANHELVLTVEPMIEPSPGQNVQFLEVTEATYGTNGLETLIGLFGLNDIEQAFLIDADGIPYFSTEPQEFPFLSVFSGFEEPKLLGSLNNGVPGAPATNVYGLSGIDGVTAHHPQVIDLFLSPVPTTDQLQVRMHLGQAGSKKLFPFVIMNVEGQTVRQGILSADQLESISLQSLPAGTYYFGVRMGGGFYTRPFVKE